MKKIILFIIGLGIVLFVYKRPSTGPITKRESFEFKDIQEKRINGVVDSYFSLQQQIYQNKRNDIINLEKDVYIDLAVDVNRNVEIDGNDHNIYFEKVSSGFVIQPGYSLKIKNAKIHMNKTLVFCISNSIDTQLILDNTQILLYEKSSFDIKTDSLSMKNNVIKIKEGIEISPDSNLLFFEGNHLTLTSNLIMNPVIGFSNELVINKVQYGIISGNMIIGNFPGYNAPVKLANSQNVAFFDNIIYDLADTKNNILTTTKNSDPRVIQETGKILTGGFAMILSRNKNIDYSKGNWIVNKNCAIEENKIMNFPKNAGLDVLDIKQFLNNAESICDKKDLFIKKQTYINFLCKF